MRKIIKVIVCIGIILLTILGFAAKYQTHGIYLGQFPDSGEIRKAVESSKSKLICHYTSPDYYTYQNRFGRTVFVITGNSSHGNGRCIFHYREYAAKECTLCDFLNKRVVFVRTAAPSLCTHLDFFGYLYNNKGDFYLLLQKAGMPAGYSPQSCIDGYSNSTGFYFDTVDGYRYYLRMLETGEVTVNNIEAPNGNSIYSRKLILHIALFYLCIAAALLVFLICFLKIYNLLRKRNAEKAGLSSTQDPAKKQQFTKAIICILLILLTLLHISASWDYCVADVHTPSFSSNVKAITSNGYIVFLNCYNRITVMRRLSNSRFWFIPIGTFSQKVCTNFSMLALSKGMPFYIMCEVLGMPASTKGSAGHCRLIYETQSGFTYEIYLQQSESASMDTVDSWTITAPDGTELNITAYQWQVRLTYLGIAAGLSAIAAALIIISKRRRKSTA